MENFQNNTKECEFHSVISAGWYSRRKPQELQLQENSVPVVSISAGTELSEEKVTFVTNKCDMKSKPHSFLCVRLWVSYLHYPNLELLGIYPCQCFSKTYFM